VITLATDVVGYFLLLMGFWFTVFHFVNLFSEDGVAEDVVDFEGKESFSHTPRKRLKKLESLMAEGIISSSEYQSQRNRILNDI